MGNTIKAIMVLRDVNIIENVVDKKNNKIRHWLHDISANYSYEKNLIYDNLAIK